MILAGIAALVYYWQLDAMQEGVQQSKEAFESAIVNTRRDQRAWIGVSGVSHEPNFDEATDTTVTLLIRNSGNLPATTHMVVNPFKERKFPFPKKDFLLGDEESKGTVVLFPGATMQITATIPTFYYDEEFSDLFPFCGIHGLIWYEDEFGEHKTKFCFFRKKGMPKTQSLQMDSVNNWFE